MKSRRPKPLMFTDLSGVAENLPAANAAPDTAEAVVASGRTMKTAVFPEPGGAPLGMAGDRRTAKLSVPKPARAPKPPKPPKTAKPRQDLGFARHAYTAAVLAALVWAGALIAFVAGFQTRYGAFDYTPLQWGVIGLLALLPAAFMLLAAFAVRQGASLAVETRRVRAMADDLAIPAALASDQAGGAMEAMRREIEKATEAARAARAPMVALRETLAMESQRLFEAAAEAQATGRLLTESLSRERLAMGDASQALQQQSVEAAEALARQARMVADASDLAQAQLDEAQAALTARAADLAVAAGDARHAAVTATEQLGQQIERMEGAGDSLGARIGAVAGDIGRERMDLAALAEMLRADQLDIAARLETQRAQLAEAAVDARDGAAALGSAATEGADALRGLIATASVEVDRLAETARREQEALDTRARAALGLFSGAVAEETAALQAQSRAAIEDLVATAEEARNLAANHVEAAAEAAREHVDAARAGLAQMTDEVAARIDTLGEAAFDAAQRADQALDARMASIRRLIDQSVGLVDEAGQRSAERIEASLANARAATGDLDAVFGELDRRLDALPEAARIQAASVRKALELGMGELTAAARRAAEETQAIDAAFQERVRKNYEILSDAVRLMGRVAASADVARPPPQPSTTAELPLSPPAAGIKPAAPVIKPAAAQPETPRETLPELRAAVAGDRTIRVPLSDAGATQARYGATEPMRPAALSEAFGGEPAPRRTDTVTAAAAGLRPRLRLTPTGAEDGGAPPAAPAQPQSQTQADAKGADEEWTWKGLLSSMDETGGGDDDTLAERLIGEIEALGVDTAALLTRARIDEIAAALQTGDTGGAREVVRRLAPSAVRRLSRRVLTDKVLRAQADRYVRRYEELISDSAQRDREGYMTAALLGSDPGRAFLLLDAAIGDLH